MLSCFNNVGFKSWHNEWKKHLIQHSYINYHTCQRYLRNSILNLTCVQVENYEKPEKCNFKPFFLHNLIENMVIYVIKTWTSGICLKICTHKIIKARVYATTIQLVSYTLLSTPLQLNKRMCEFNTHKTVSS